MLKKIIIKNVNSIGECVIDFEKGNYRYLEDNVEGDIVNPLAFYGHNGSGKSSVFVAMAYLINLMVEPAESLLPFVVNHFLYEEYESTYKLKINSFLELFLFFIYLFFIYK